MVDHCSTEEPKTRFIAGDIMTRYYTHFADTFPFPKAAAEDFRNIISALIYDAFPDREDMAKLPDWYLSRYDLVENGKPSSERLSRHAEKADLTGIPSGIRISYNEESGMLEFNSGEYTEALYGDMYAVAEVLADVMEEHGCEEPVSFEVSYGCDCPLPGEYGGEAFVVGPGIVEAMGTSEMVSNLWQKVEQEIKRKQSQTPTPGRS